MRFQLWTLKKENNNFATRIKPNILVLVFAIISHTVMFLPCESLFLFLVNITRFLEEKKKN